MLAYVCCVLMNFNPRTLTMPNPMSRRQVVFSMALPRRTLSTTEVGETHVVPLFPLFPSYVEPHVFAYVFASIWIPRWHPFALMFMVLGNRFSMICWVVFFLICRRLLDPQWFSDVSSVDPADATLPPNARLGTENVPTTPCFQFLIVSYRFRYGAGDLFGKYSIFISTMRTSL